MRSACALGPCDWVRRRRSYGQVAQRARLGPRKDISSAIDLTFNASSLTSSRSAGPSSAAVGPRAPSFWGSSRSAATRLPSSSTAWVSPTSHTHWFALYRGAAPFAVASCGHHLPLIRRGIVPRSASARKCRSSPSSSAPHHHADGGVHLAGGSSGSHAGRARELHAAVILSFLSADSGRAFPSRAVASGGVHKSRSLAACRTWTSKRKGRPRDSEGWAADRAGCPDVRGIRTLPVNCPAWGAGRS